MCGRAGSGRSATVLMRLTGAARLGSTRGYSESYNLCPGNHILALVRRPVKDREEGRAEADEGTDTPKGTEPTPAEETEGEDIVVKGEPTDEGNDTDKGPCDEHKDDDDKKDDDDQQGPAVAAAGEKEVVLEALKWGLVPWFTKPDNVLNTGYQTINARAETVSSRPSFRHLVNRRRCVVVADGFFEWKKYDVMGQLRRQAFYVRPKSPKTLDGHEMEPQPLYMAGLWDTWKDKASGKELRTCVILTTEATTEFAGIHDRMPVVLQPENVPKWLDSDEFKFNQLTHLLSPYKDNNLDWYEVCDKVNNIKNKTAENIEPLAVHKAKGIGRFFTNKKEQKQDMTDAIIVKPATVVDAFQTVKPGKVLDDDAVLVGDTPMPDKQRKPVDNSASGAKPQSEQSTGVKRSQGSTKKEPPKKKVELQPGQKSLSSFFK